VDATSPPCQQATTSVSTNHIFAEALFEHFSQRGWPFQDDTSAIDDSHPPDALRSGISDLGDADFFTSLQPDILESLLVFACISFRVTFLFWACGSLRVTTIPKLPEGDNRG
jgi:hypothetical protein